MLIDSNLKLVQQLSKHHDIYRNWVATFEVHRCRFGKAGRGLHTGLASDLKHLHYENFQSASNVMDKDEINAPSDVSL